MMLNKALVVERPTSTMSSLSTRPAIEQNKRALNNQSDLSLNQYAKDVLKNGHSGSQTPIVGAEADYQFKKGPPIEIASSPDQHQAAKRRVSDTSRLTGGPKSGNGPGGFLVSQGKAGRLSGQGLRKFSAANTSKSGTSSVCVIGGGAQGAQWLEKRYETKNNVSPNAQENQPNVDRPMNLETNLTTNNSRPTSKHSRSGSSVMRNSMKRRGQQRRSKNMMGAPLHSAQGIGSSFTGPYTASPGQTQYDEHGNTQFPGQTLTINTTNDAAVLNPTGNYVFSTFNSNLMNNDGVMVLQQLPNHHHHHHLHKQIHHFHQRQLSGGQPSLMVGQSHVPLINHAAHAHKSISGQAVISETASRKKSVSQVLYESQAASKRIRPFSAIVRNGLVTSSNQRHNSSHQHQAALQLNNAVNMQFSHLMSPTNDQTLSALSAQQKNQAFSASMRIKSAAHNRKNTTTDQSIVGESVNLLNSQQKQQQLLQHQITSGQTIIAGQSLNEQVGASQAQFSAQSKVPNRQTNLLQEHYNRPLSSKFQQQRNNVPLHQQHLRKNFEPLIQRNLALKAKNQTSSPDQASFLRSCCSGKVKNAAGLMVQSTTTAYNNENLIMTNNVVVHHHQVRLTTPTSGVEIAYMNKQGNETLDKPVSGSMVGKKLQSEGGILSSTLNQSDSKFRRAVELDITDKAGGHRTMEPTSPSQVRLSEQIFAKTQNGVQSLKVRPTTHFNASLLQNEVLRKSLQSSHMLSLQKQKSGGGYSEATRRGDIDSMSAVDFQRATGKTNENKNRNSFDTIKAKVTTPTPHETTSAPSIEIVQDRECIDSARQHIIGVIEDKDEKIGIIQDNFTILEEAHHLQSNQTTDGTLSASQLKPQTNQSEIASPPRDQVINVEDQKDPLSGDFLGQISSKQNQNMLYGEHNMQPKVMSSSRRSLLKQQLLQQAINELNSQAPTLAGNDNMHNLLKKHHQASLFSYGARRRLDQMELSGVPAQNMKRSIQVQKRMGMQLGLNTYQTSDYSVGRKRRLFQSSKMLNSTDEINREPWSEMERIQELAMVRGQQNIKRREQSRKLQKTDQAKQKSSVDDATKMKDKKKQTKTGPKRYIKTKKNEMYKGRSQKPRTQTDKQLLEGLNVKKLNIPKVENSAHSDLVKDGVLSVVSQPTSVGSPTLKGNKINKKPCSRPMSPKSSIVTQIPTATQPMIEVAAGNKIQLTDVLDSGREAQPDSSKVETFMIEPLPIMLNKNFVNLNLNGVLQQPSDTAQTSAQNLHSGAGDTKTTTQPLTDVASGQSQSMHTRPSVAAMMMNIDSHPTLFQHGRGERVSTLLNAKEPTNQGHVTSTGKQSTLIGPNEERAQRRTIQLSQEWIVSGNTHETTGGPNKEAIEDDKDVELGPHQEIKVQAQKDVRNSKLAQIEVIGLESRGFDIDVGKIAEPLIINSEKTNDVDSQSKQDEDLKKGLIDARKRNYNDHKRPKSQYQIRRKTLDQDGELIDFDQDEQASMGSIYFNKEATSPQIVSRADHVKHNRTLQANNIKKRSLNKENTGDLRVTTHVIEVQDFTSSNLRKDQDIYTTFSVKNNNERNPLGYFDDVKSEKRFIQDHQMAVNEDTENKTPEQSAMTLGGKRIRQRGAIVDRNMSKTMLSSDKDSRLLHAKLSVTNIMFQGQASSRRDFHSTINEKRAQSRLVAADQNYTHELQSQDMLVKDAAEVTDELNINEPSSNEPQKIVVKPNNNLQPQAQCCQVNHRNQYNYSTGGGGHHSGTYHTSKKPKKKAFSRKNSASARATTLGVNGQPVNSRHYYFSSQHAARSRKNSGGVGKTKFRLKNNRQFIDIDSSCFTFADDEDNDGIQNATAQINNEHDVNDDGTLQPRTKDTLLDVTRIIDQQPNSTSDYDHQVHMLTFDKRKSNHEAIESRELVAQRSAGSQVELDMTPYQSQRDEDTGSQKSVSMEAGFQDEIGGQRIDSQRKEVADQGVQASHNTIKVNESLLMMELTDSQRAALNQDLDTQFNKD